MICNKNIILLILLNNLLIKIFHISIILILIYRGLSSYIPYYTITIPDFIFSLKNLKKL